MRYYLPKNARVYVRTLALIPLCALVSLYQLYSQVTGVAKFVKVYPSYAQSGFVDMDLCKDGQILLAGYYEYDIELSKSHKLGSRDGRAFIAKMNKNGDCVWTLPFKASMRTELYAICHDGAGGCYVTGEYLGDAQFGNTLLEFDADGRGFLARVDEKGNWLWVVTLGSAGRSNQASISISDVQIDKDNNPVVIGYYSHDYFKSQQEYHKDEGRLFIASYTPKSNLLWTVTAPTGINYGHEYILNLGSSQWQKSVAGLHIGKSGRIYFWGAVKDSVTGGSIGYLDEVQRIRTVAQFGVQTYFHQILVDDDGSIYAYGSEGKSSSSIGFICKLNEVGEIQWVKSGAGKIYWSSVKRVDGRLLSAACIESNFQFGEQEIKHYGGQDVLLLDIRNNGEINSFSVFGGKDGRYPDENAYGMSCSAEGNIYVCGQISSSMLIDGKSYETTKKGSANSMLICFKK